MKKLYALALLASMLAAPLQAQPPCLSNFTTPAGQTQATTGWNTPTLPPTMSGNVPTTTTAGSNTATVGSAAGLVVGMGVSGPNIPPGTTITAISGTTLTLSNTATGTGTSLLHTYTTLGPWAQSYPPQNVVFPGSGTNSATCSVCPAVFSINMCAGQWFPYYMCAGNIYTFTMCGAATSWNSVLAITTVGGTALGLSSPPSWDNDGCGTANGHATLNFVPTTSATYRVRLWNNTCTVNGTQCGLLQVACNPAPAPPSNDNATTAISLGSPAPTSCTFTGGTTAFATQSPGVPSGCLAGGCGSDAGGFGGYDVWYSVGVPASGNLSVILQEISAGPTTFAVYTGTPPTLAIVPGSCTCNDFVSLSGLTAGSTVYIRVWPTGGFANSGSFQICAYEPIPPPNDNPCGATGMYALAVGTSCNLTPFSTQNATSLTPSITLSPPAPSCGTPVAGGDVWFSAVMPGTGSMTINTQAGTLNDMAMSVYTLTSGGVCATATLTEVACNDNFGASTMPSVTVSGLPGTTYYIRMWNKTTAFGTASICAIVNTPPTNDNPCGALPLPVAAGCYFNQPYTNQFASLTPNSLPGQHTSISAPSCGAPVNNDVWFTATVPSNGQLQLDTDDL
ncbi:MAG: hypothetical protein ACK4L7_06770, partial [Flavobacteriales bacterium]